MCLLITVATRDKQNSFIWANTYLFIILSNSSQHIGMDMLVRNHNQYLNICVLNICSVTVSLFCKQSMCRSRTVSVSTAHKPSLSVCLCNTELGHTNRSYCESDWCRNGRKPEHLAWKLSLFWCAMCVIRSIPVNMCTISFSALICSASCQH